MKSADPKDGAVWKLALTDVNPNKDRLLLVLFRQLLCGGPVCGVIAGDGSPGSGTEEAAGADACLWLRRMCLGRLNHLNCIQHRSILSCSTMIFHVYLLSPYPCCFRLWDPSLNSCIRSRRVRCKSSNAVTRFLVCVSDILGLHSVNRGCTMLPNQQGPARCTPQCTRR